MKKFTKVFVAICVMMALALSLVACATSGTDGKDEQGRFKLLVPEVTISNNHVSWKAVRYCTTYGVKIDGEEIRVDRTFYTLSGDKDVASLQVRSIGDDETTVSSGYSKPVSYKAKTRLANPQQPTITEDGDNIVLNWNKVENATSYTIEKSQSIAEGITTYTSNTNSFTISKSSISTPDVYSFRVRSENKSGEFLRSDFSVKSEYKTTKNLKEVAPKFDGSNITWDEVESANSYEIYMQKVSGAGANDSKLVVATLSSSKSYSSSQITTAVTKYKEEWEKKNKGQTMELAGEYKVYIRAINVDYPQVYIAAEEPTLVDKVTKDGDEEKREEIIFKKPGKVSEVKVGKQQITTTEGDTVEVDMLTWASSDYSKFKLKIYSNESNLVDTNLTIEEGKQNEENLTSSFSDKFKEHAGKVVEISIAVQADIANGILEGEETFWVNDADINQQYCYVPDSLKESNEGEFKGYYQIDNIGGLRYMLDNADSTDKKFYLTKNIDGVRSNKNCNFYISDNVFNSIFDGNGFAISNINLIVDARISDKSFISLVKEIANDAVIKNVTFNNVTITSTDGNVSRIALLAQTNNGTIQGVNIVNSRFETRSSVAGFVGVNNGSIKACSFLGTTITATGYDVEKENGEITDATKAIDAAAVAIANNGEIFNINIYDSEITGTTRYATARVGGIVMENKGSISNSFLRESLVIARTSANDNNDVYAVAGGVVAENIGGSISQCYLANNGSSTKSVEAISNRAFGTSAKMDATAGGLVGIMKGGDIDSCYVAFARISSNSIASGLVGDKDDAAITISNSYAHNLTFEQATTRSMILSKTSGVTATKVYAFVGDAKQVDTNNAKVLNNRNEIKTQDLGDKFVLNEKDFEYPILKNMIYSNYGSGTSLNVYIVTENNKKEELTTEGIDVGTSKRLMIFKTDVTGVELTFTVFRAK